MLNNKRNDSAENKDSSQSWLEWSGNQKKCVPKEGIAFSHTTSNNNHTKNALSLNQLLTI